MNRRRPWTEKEQHDLLRWTDEGISLERVAVRLNRTVMAVQNRLYALKGKPKPKAKAKPGLGPSDQTPPVTD